MRVKFQIRSKLALFHGKLQSIVAERAGVNGLTEILGADRTLHLQPPRLKRPTRQYATVSRLEMRGHWLVPVDKDTERLAPTQDGVLLLYFDMQPLDDERLEITAVTTDPDVDDYAWTLLLAIAESYPKSAEAINRALSSEKRQAVGQAQEETANIAENLEPWERIPNYRWDRDAVRMLWEGYEDSEIAKHVSPPVVPKTVINRLSRLRKQYPDEVPTRSQLRRKRS